MKVLSTVLIWLSYFWFTLAFLLITVAVGFEFYRGGFWHGWDRVTYWFSPFNLWNWFAVLITFLPGIGLNWLGRWLKE